MLINHCYGLDPRVVDQLTPREYFGLLSNADYVRQLRIVELAVALAIVLRPEAATEYCQLFGLDASFFMGPTTKVTDTLDNHIRPDDVVVNDPRQFYNILNQVKGK